MAPSDDPQLTARPSTSPAPLLKSWEQCGAGGTWCPPRTALRIVVYYWFAPPEGWAFAQFNHDFNMELLQRFDEEGIDLALPPGSLPRKQDPAT